MKNPRVLALAKLIEETFQYQQFNNDPYAIAEGLLEQGVKLPNE